MMVCGGGVARCLHPVQERGDQDVMKPTQKVDVANIGIHPLRFIISFLPLSIDPIQTLHPVPNLLLNPDPDMSLVLNPEPEPSSQAQTKDMTTNSNPNLTLLAAPRVALPGVVALDPNPTADPNMLAAAEETEFQPANRSAFDFLPLPADDVVEDFSKLNRSDLDELDRHEDLIGRVERDYLGKVKSKPEIFPQRFRDADYLSNSAIMLLSTGWSSAHKYAHCCIRGQVNRGGACKVHKYCPYCSWYAGEKAQLTYVPAFGDGNWHWLTGSYSGDLLYDGSAGAAVNWLHHWDAYQAGFNEWLENNTVRGIYWTEELAVNSFCPTRVLPHVHAVVDADELNEAALEQVQESVNAHMAKVVGVDHLQPDLDVEEIGTQRNLMNRIGYMFKPLKLVRPYRNAWAGACLHHRAGAQQLNNAATDLVLGFSQVSRMLPHPVLGYEKAKSGRNKMQARGTLDPKRRKNFIGKHKDQHKHYKRLLRELREEAAEEYIEVREVDEVEDEMTFAE